MNKRIRELYRFVRPKEALASQDLYSTSDVLLGAEVEKFADLLVQECLANLHFHGYDDALNQLKSHFGVKE